MENIVGNVSVKKDFDNEKYLLIGFYESFSNEKVIKYIDGCKINVFNFFLFVVMVLKKIGDILVLDVENKCVYIFDWEGNYLS